MNLVLQRSALETALALGKLPDPSIATMATRGSCRP